MPTVEEYTDPYLSSYTYVPAAGLGVCQVCHGFVHGDWRRCWSCNRTHRQVSHPARLVVPISHYLGNGPLWHVLRRYKDGWSQAVRDPLGMRMSATLGRFVRDHEACLSDGEPRD